ncbi:hypothetical protein NKH77_32090 [Streptomyces sp. M19]
MPDVIGLLHSDERAAVARTVRDNNPGMSQEMAERIVDEATKFVAVCAKNPHERLRPSRVVDEGWHALILHTALYTDFCRIFGRFVHHTPESPDPARHDPDALTRTQEHIVASGFTVDDALWLAPTDETIPVAASCSHGPGSPEGRAPLTRTVLTAPAGRTDVVLTGGQR